MKELDEGIAAIRAIVKTSEFWKEITATEMSIDAEEALMRTTEAQTQAIRD